MKISKIKYVMNFLDWKKEINDTTIKDIRNLLRLEKENKVIKDIIIRGIKIICNHEEEGYYKE